MLCGICSLAVLAHPYRRWAAVAFVHQDPPLIPIEAISLGGTATLQHECVHPGLDQADGSGSGSKTGADYDGIVRQKNGKAEDCGMSACALGVWSLSSVQ